MTVQQKEALEALDRARETGLIQSLTVITSSSTPEVGWETA